jgi:hypothetical protein
MLLSVTLTRYYVGTARQIPTDNTKAPALSLVLSYTCGLLPVLPYVDKAVRLV